MKICPRCDKTYLDEELNFCLMDGSALVSSESQPTVVIKPASPTEPYPRSKRSGVFWLTTAFGAIVAVACAGVLGAFLYSLSTTDSDDRTTPKTTRSSIPTPTQTGKERKSPSPSPETNTSVTGKSPTPTDPEFTPIAWSNSTLEFYGNEGDKFYFECPPGGTPGPVWGIDVYTGASSICTAAVHYGVITTENGGRVTIEIRAGRSIYGGTPRNGITSNAYGAFPSSFVILK